jgi:hypothetical protein
MVQPKDSGRDPDEGLEDGEALVQQMGESTVQQMGGTVQQMGKVTHSRWGTLVQQMHLVQQMGKGRRRINFVRQAEWIGGATVTNRRDGGGCSPRWPPPQMKQKVFNLPL